ncbi:hypothetical protein BDY21DRAFT_424295 [Lineolata rhizophorae]|uniref:NAD(P)-binding protein n=1 Tax=Lineolata rhizophorae TaxID=578093 RepID=A0A6A6NQ78_9PEZI|nr:hypothetical protein BDY21DRAFT_424295 [Lineolata rhizophorae]
MALSSLPTHFGITFTSTLHSKPEGLTEPKSIKLPSPFVVAIAGGSRGIGLSIAQAYAEAARTCDVAQQEDVDKFSAGVKAKFGRLDVAVFNSAKAPRYLQDADGTLRLSSHVLEDVEEFHGVTMTNFLGAVYLAKSLLPLLMETKDGMQTLICITSASSHFGSSNVTPASYNISKLAMNRLIETVDSDYRDQGIQSFAVHPGVVLTDLTARHSETVAGDFWKSALTDDPRLCAGFLVWLTKEKRQWLSGRYLAANWDVEELEAKREHIVNEDALKFHMVV